MAQIRQGSNVWVNLPSKKTLQQQNTDGITPPYVFSIHISPHARSWCISWCSFKSLSKTGWGVLHTSKNVEPAISFLTESLLYILIWSHKFHLVCWGFSVFRKNGQTMPTMQYNFLEVFVFRIYLKCIPFFPSWQYLSHTIYVFSLFWKSQYLQGCVGVHGCVCNDGCVCLIAFFLFPSTEQFFQLSQKIDGQLLASLCFSCSGCDQWSSNSLEVLHHFTFMNVLISTWVCNVKTKLHFHCVENTKCCQKQKQNNISCKCLGWQRFFFLEKTSSKAHKWSKFIVHLLSGMEKGVTAVKQRCWLMEALVVLWYKHW